MRPKIKYFNETGTELDKKDVGNLLNNGEKVGIEIVIPPMLLEELIFLQKTLRELDEGFIRIN